MQKDFDKWNNRKKKIDSSIFKPPQIEEGSIWWSYFGVNIGREIDGKGGSFSRPVLVLKKINHITFLVAPLSTSENYNDEWHSTIDFNNRRNVICFNQIKVIDYKRLKIKIGNLENNIFESLLVDFERLYTKRTNLLAEVGHRDLRSIASAGALDQSISNTHNKSSHDYNQQALDLHRANGGKLEVVSKVRLQNREDLSKAYTPGVAQVCREIAKDKNLDKVYTLKKNTVAIVSDGSAILGLGNLGASAAIPVMEGKAAILKEFADVDAFPICIESQDKEEIIKIVKNIAPVFGGINLEDIASPQCFEIEERLRSELDIPVMHDDQWGAATVALTAFINSLKLANKNKEDIKVVLSGVGAAGVATGRLLQAYGVKNLILVDSHGIVNIKRKNNNELNKEKIELLDNSNIQDLEGGLIEAIVGADVFIGLSKPNVLTKEMVKTMSEKPIIFALANPNPEILPEDAKEARVFIVGTGRSDYPNQINNSLVFPGFWRGVLDVQNRGDYKKIDINTFVKIAERLASHTKNLNTENILPDMFDKEVVNVVAESM